MTDPQHHQDDATHGTSEAPTPSDRETTEAAPADAASQDAAAAQTASEPGPRSSEPAGGQQKAARVRRRTPKQDAELSQAVGLAREALVDSFGAQDVGDHVGVDVHQDRLLTHLFDCRAAGYPGWTWYATLARAPRTKVVTVCEVGLISGENSLLAPDWVPWEERMQAVKDQEEQEARESQEDDHGSEDPGTTPDARREDGTAGSSEGDGPDAHDRGDHRRAAEDPAPGTSEATSTDEGEDAPTGGDGGVETSSDSSGTGGTGSGGRSRSRRSRGNRRATSGARARDDAENGG